MRQYKCQVSALVIQKIGTVVGALTPTKLRGGTERPVPIKASRVKDSSASGPFQSHSRTPPIREIGSEMSRGAACSKAMASRKFDLPEPFGPMRTFKGSIGRSTPLGPKDRRPETFNLWSNMFSAQGRAGHVAQHAEDVRFNFADVGLDLLNRPRSTSSFVGASTQSRRRSIVKGRVTGWYFPRLKLSRIRSATPIGS